MSNSTNTPQGKQRPAGNGQLNLLSEEGLEVLKPILNGFELQAKATYQQSLHREKEIAANKEIALKAMEYQHTDNGKNIDMFKWVFHRLQIAFYIIVFLVVIVIGLSMYFGYLNQLEHLIKQFFNYLAAIVLGVGGKSYLDSRKGSKSNKSDIEVLDNLESN